MDAQSEIQQFSEVFWASIPLPSSSPDFVKCLNSVQTYRIRMLGEASNSPKNHQWSCQYVSTEDEKEGSLIFGQDPNVLKSFLVSN